MFRYPCSCVFLCVCVWHTGVLLISLALCADAAIGNVQEKAMKLHNGSNSEMVPCLSKWKKYWLATKSVLTALTWLCHQNQSSTLSYVLSRIVIIMNNWLVSCVWSHWLVMWCCADRCCTRTPSDLSTYWQACCVWVGWGRQWHSAQRWVYFETIRVYGSALYVMLLCCADNNLVSPAPVWFSWSLTGWCFVLFLI